MLDATDNTYTCNCGHEVTIPETGGTGYATLPDGRVLCYACTDAAERERMRTASEIVAYLSSDGAQITTWSGGPLAAVLYQRVARIRTFGGRARAQITYYRAVDATGQTWYGQAAGRGMVTRMRRCK